MDYDPLPFAVATLIERVARLVVSDCLTEELPPVQWSALRCLGHNTGRRTVSALAAYSGISHSSASRTVAVLIRKGLVAAEAERQGGRRRRLTLTESGWNLLKKDPLRRLANTISSLPSDEKISLHNSLISLINTMSGRSGRGSSGGSRNPS